MKQSGSSIWVDIDGFNGIYQINENGSVRKVHKLSGRFQPTVMRQQEIKGKRGKYITLTKNNKRFRYKVDILLNKYSHQLKLKNQEMCFELNNIVSIVSKHFNVSESTIRDKKRGKEEETVARQICHKLAKETTKYSLSKIGAEIGHTNHTSVLNSIKSISNLIETDISFKSKYMYVYDYVIKNTSTPITKKIEELIPL